MAVGIVQDVLFNWEMVMSYCGMCRYANCAGAFVCSCECHQLEIEDNIKELDSISKAKETNQLEQTYEQLVDQMHDKVNEAVVALNEAYRLSEIAKIKALPNFDKWYDLKDAVRSFIDFEDNNGWTCSSW